MTVLKFLIGGAFLIVIGIILLFGFLKFDAMRRILSQMKILQSLKIDSVSNGQSSTQKLIQSIEKIIDNTQGTYSVYIYDLKRKNGVGINEQTIMTGASVNKIAILTALYYFASQGDIDLEKVIILQPEDIQDYGSGAIRYDQPGTPYSIKTLARLMMQKSDNTASYLLGNHILTLDKIQKLIDKWGLTQTSMTDNKTSAKDMGILLMKIYQGEVASKENTAEMLNFMERSDFDDRIPAGLPTGTRIYHKTGEAVGKIHDVGIVDLSGSPYYIGVLTSDITDEENTKKTISAISRTVYDYMSTL